MSVAHQAPATHTIERHRLLTIIGHPRTPAQSSANNDRVLEGGKEQAERSVFSLLTVLSLSDTTLYMLLHCAGVFGWKVMIRSAIPSPHNSTGTGTQPSKRKATSLHKQYWCRHPAGTQAS
eukprot:1141360-Pelagomonas_calceolata.AAC.4